MQSRLYSKAVSFDAPGFFFFKFYTNLKRSVVQYCGAGAFDN